MSNELETNLKQRRDLRAQRGAFKDFDEKKINIKNRFSIPDWFWINAWSCYQVIGYSSILGDENTSKRAIKKGAASLSIYLQYKNEIKFTRVCLDIGIALLAKDAKLLDDCLILINQSNTKEINTPSRLFCAYLAATYLKDYDRTSELNKCSAKLYKKALFKNTIEFNEVFDAINERNKQKIETLLNEILTVHHKTVSHHRARDYDQAESFICLFALGVLWLCSIRNIDTDCSGLNSKHKLLLPVTDIHEVPTKKRPKHEIVVDYIFLAKDML